MEKLYTVEEVAELACVTPRTIRNYLKDGRIDGRKIGGQWRFAETEVQRLLSGEGPAQKPAKKTQDAPVQYLQDPKEQEGAGEGKAHAGQPAPPYPDDAEEEVYQDTSADFNGEDGRHNVVVFSPEASFAPESYEAKIPQQQPAPPPADTPTRLPYTMPIKENPGHTTVPVADAAGFNPAFPYLSGPATPTPVDVLNQPNVAPPYGMQVPGNPQINYFGAAGSAQPYPMAQQSMPMYYASPAPYNPPVLANPIYAQGPFAPQYATAPQYVAAPAPPPPPAEEEAPAYKPSHYRAEKEALPEKREREAEKIAGESPKDREDPPFELSDIGAQAALFASEVHDCSQGPQICTMIDLHQSLASAKITSERLMEIAEQESEIGPACHSYVEFDTRYYIARYTLFGTSEFLARCLKLLG